MIDPAMIALMDQAQAAFRTWARTYAMAVEELEQAGFSRREAIDAASEWMAILVADAAERSRG